MADALTGHAVAADGSNGLRRRRGSLFKANSESRPTDEVVGDLFGRPTSVRWLPWLLRKLLTYTGVFMLGTGFSAVMWPGSFSVPEQVTTAASLYASTSNEYFEQFVDHIMNGTLKIREAFDQQAIHFRGRLNLSSLVSFNLQDVFKSMKVPTLRVGNLEQERVGTRMSKLGMKVQHPVVMIPGIITTGLELWDGEACIKSYFRQRIWGSSTMLQSLMSDPDCWARHLALNSTTGLDPLQSPDFNRSIRVRPAQGFESADFFVGGYWLWGIMIEAFADIGYDYNSMYMASYDWRLGFPELELRDRYFTRLRQQIEMLVAMNGQKAVVVSHSMGGNVWHYFMQWVTHRVHRNWVHDYIHAEVAISVPMLGLPKAFFSLLTGDNRDFASMGRGFSAVMTHLFGPLTRRKLWWSCSSLAMIMPTGGESVWGENFTGCPLLRVGNRSLNVSESLDLLAAESAVPRDLERISPWLLDGARRNRPQQVRRGVASHEPPEHVWGNALATSLPFAPELHKYAFYGVGVPSDVSAVLKETGDDKTMPRFSIDYDATDSFGFHLANGDNAVPLRSLGLMCLKGWKDEARNPARTPCTIREYLDNPSLKGNGANDRATLEAAKAAGASPAQILTALLTGGYSRGGQPSGDHIDILGNVEMLEDLLTIVSGGQVQERIISDIQAAADSWQDE